MAYHINTQSEALAIINSRNYGPQFNPKDGTIGKLKLVKRFVIVESDGTIWHGRNGFQNKNTRDEMENLLKSFYANNLTDAVPAGLEVKEWWCYPRHFDACGPVEIDENR